MTPWRWVLLQKTPVTQLLANLSTFYGTLMFIPVYTRALHWSILRGRWTQSTPPYPISLRSILILSSHLHLGLSIGLLPSGFLAKTLYEFRVPMSAIYHTHIIVLDLITLSIFGEEYMLRRSLLYCFLKFLIFKRSSVQRFSQHSVRKYLFLNVRDQVSHSGKIILIF
jgi:hypothetical protein